MRSQINLGRVFGIRIGLHYSWFIIAFLIVFSLSAQFHTSNPEWGDSVILALAGASAILFFGNSYSAPSFVRRLLAL